MALLITVVYGYVKYSHLEAIGPVILFFVLPDIAILGYVISNRVGAFLYNLTHSLILPLSFLCLWLLAPIRIVLYFALAGLAHAGMDRALGYGLKYNDGFKHTHLGFIGKKRA